MNEEFLNYEDSQGHDLATCSCDTCHAAMEIHHGLHVLASQKKEKSPLLCSPLCFDIADRIGCADNIDAFPVPFLPHIFAIAFVPEGNPLAMIEQTGPLDSALCAAYIAAAKAFYNELHHINRSRKENGPEHPLIQFQRMDA